MAQTSMGLSVGGSLDQEDRTLNFIKEGMVTAVQENKKLNKENRALKNELVGLQLAVEQSENKVDALMAQQKSLPNDFAMREGQNRQAPSTLEEFGIDDMIKEARAIYLSGQSEPLSEIQRLQELYLYDLQYQKQELLLELKSKQAQYQSVGENRLEELDRIQQDIQDNIQQRKELELRSIDQEKAIRMYPKEIDLLKMENQAFRQEIDLLESMLVE